MSNGIDPKEIEEQLREIVAEQLGLDEAQVTREARLAEDLGADSLDCVEICMAIEETFGCDIAEEDSAKWNTFGDMVKFFEDKFAQ